MRNKRLMIIIAIIALAIGFATVSTVLYINGTTEIATNDESFRRGIIFTNASTDEGGSVIIEQEGRVLTYTSKVLVQKDDETELNYEISNLDKNYDASAKMSCKFIDEELNESETNELVEITYEKNTFNILSGAKVNGTINVKLIHNAEVATEIGIKCTVLATAIERTSAGSVTLQNTNSFNGVISDASGNALTSGYLAVFSNEMKVVELQSDGSFEVTGLEDGTHEIYYMGSTNPTELSKGQVIEQALASGEFTTTATNGIIEIEKEGTKYKIAKVYDVTFEGSNFTVNPTTLKYVVGKENKVTVTPENKYFIESIECTNGYTTNAKVGDGEEYTQEITISNNNNSSNSVCTITTANVINKFESDSWATIAANIKSGNTSRYKVDDTKIISMDGFGTHTLRVANNSNYDCELESKTACGFVIEFADIIRASKMNSVSTNVGGWPSSSLYKYLNPIEGDDTSGTIYKALPEDLQKVIIDTKVVSGQEYKKLSNYVTMDKIYLLSTAEIWSGGDSYDNAKDLSITRQLDYYTGVTASNYAKVIKKLNNSVRYWWLRTSYARNEFINHFYTANSNGKYEPNSVTNESGISPAFRIG